MEKFSSIDAVTEEKKLIPASNKYTINLKNVKPRTQVCTFHPIKRERFEKLVKDSKPGPVTYDSPTAVRKTQWSPPKLCTVWKKSTGNLSHLEKLVKMKKSIPGVGQYKNIDKGYNITVRHMRKGKY